MPFLFRFLAVFLLASLLAACGGPSREEASRNGVNRFIWRAALDTLSFLPLEQADPFSGLIVTGWGQVGGAPGLYRVSVYVERGDLGTQSLRVAAFRQAGGGSAALSPEAVNRIEDAILTRARQLRSSQSGN